MADPISVPLLDHFAALRDPRQHAKVLYPLPEILLLVLSATLAGADDFVETTLWGTEHLTFLRRFYRYANGIPSHDTLCDVFAALDPELFKACFLAWVGGLRDDDPDIIAIDGKTSRRSHDRRKGRNPLHLVSAWAARQRIVLGQQATEEKSNEITAIPNLLDELAETGQLEGALVTIDAMGCQVAIADKIVAHEADYLLALKGNQPTLETDVEDYFRTAPATELVTKTTVEKGHGRIETRIYSASDKVDWITSDRSYPGEPGFSNIKTVLKVHSRTELADRGSFDTRFYISSAPLDIERLANAARGHWGVESMHWLLDVAFKDDLSRYRAGHGAKNMAVVRRFALNLVRAHKTKGSIKTRRKCAGWNPEFLLQILQLR